MKPDTGRRRRLLWLGIACLGLMVVWLSLGYLGLVSRWPLSTLRPKQRDILLYTLKAHRQWVSTVAFSPDGKTLASGSDDTTIKLWDVAAAEQTSK